MIQRENIPYAKLHGLLAEANTVVTGNARLSMTLLQDYERQSLEQGLQVWSTPDVLSWAVWLQRTWEALQVSASEQQFPLLLNPAQEVQLWEQVIGESEAGALLMQAGATAKLCRDAWALLHGWSLGLGDAFQYNEDSRAFQGWARQFATRCAENNWATVAQLPDILARQIVSNGPELVTSLVENGFVIAGFDELSPQQRTLLDTITAAGVDVRWVQAVYREDVHGQRLACVDGRHEMETVARWVRHHLEAHPKARIGVVFPDLASQRQAFMHALDTVLVPASVRPDQYDGIRPYNISLGRPLQEYPVVMTALQLLELIAGKAELEPVSRLLRSPFIRGWEQECSARAALDRQLRRAGESLVSLRSLRHLAGQSGQRWSCPLLATLLDSASQLLAQYPARATPAQWSELFARWLQVMGWSQGRALSSVEFQSVGAWQESLGVFAGLDLVLGKLNTGVALSRLRRVVSERSFQPQSQYARVQVLGVLEAIGMQFDYLWVMGLHDGVWPEMPRPNPFIPIPLQRANGLPRSSEARELEVAKSICMRLLQSADTVIMSYPQREGEVELRPSPLISGLDEVEQSQLPLWSGSNWRELIFSSATERYTEEREDIAPPVAGEHVKGGATLFKHQAACPFRAFAEIRLGASALGQADIGLDAMTRGNLVHKILEQVWDELKTHAALCSCTPAALQTLVASKVEAAMEWARIRYPETVTTRFQQVESERMLQQVLAWLQLEQARQPFEVTKTEKSYDVCIGGMDLSLKIDRIDTLEDGSKLLIDYKTGTVQPAQWFGDRPDEPQLPLYSTVITEQVSGVLFGQVNAQEMAFKGVTLSADMVPGVKSYDKLGQTRNLGSWDEVLEEWRTVINNLGTEFSHGVAIVDPKDFPSTCTYCDLKPLCRVTEQRELKQLPDDIYEDSE